MSGSFIFIAEKRMQKMTEEDIHNMIQSWENISLLTQYIADNPQHIGSILKKAMDDSNAENWRAAWMIDKIHEKYPEQIKPYLPAITQFVLATQNHSKKRHFLKLVSLHPIPEKDEALLLNYCIDIFTNSAETIAVRVHAMQVLYGIALQEPDFAGELIELIEHELEYHNSAGLTSRARKLLPKLYKIKRQDNY